MVGPAGLIPDCANAIAWQRLNKTPAESTEEIRPAMSANCRQLLIDDLAGAVAVADAVAAAGQSIDDWSCDRVCCSRLIA